MKKYKIIAFTMLATLLARALGFVREMIIAYQYGTSIYSDSFITALTIPDLIVTGVGAAICVLYVPLYMNIVESDKEEGKRFNTTISMVLLTIAFIFVVFFSIFPKFFINLFVGGFDEEALSLTISMSRIIVFSCIPIMLGQHYKAFSQTKGKYSWAVLFGVLINISIIIGVLISSQETYILMAYAALFGNILYAIVMFIFSWKHGLRYSLLPNFKSDYFKKLIIGFIPVLFSNLIFEINQIVDRNFASYIGEGTVSSLNYSAKIINLITAVIGTSISAALYPSLVKSVNEYNRDKQNKSILEMNNFMLVFVIPIMFFVFIFSKEIVIFLFGRGNFNEDSIKVTSECLRFYSIGILGFNLKSIWIKIFNSELNTMVPAINSAIAIIINIGLNFALVGTMKYKGLALATGIASILTDLLLIIIFSIKHKWFKKELLIKDFFKILISAIPFWSLIFLKKILCFTNSINLIIEIICFILLFLLYVFILYFIKNTLVLDFGNKLIKKKK